MSERGKATKTSNIGLGGGGGGGDDVGFANDNDIEQPLLLNEEEIVVIAPPPATAPILLLQAPNANTIHAQNVQLLGSDVSHGDGDSDGDVVEATAPFPASPGQWKDGLCNCCTHGCCHPSLICSCFCPLIAIAQVMRRLNLLMTGHQGTNFQSKITFLVLLGIFILYYFYGTSKNLEVSWEYHEHEHDHEYNHDDYDHDHDGSTIPYYNPFKNYTMNHMILPFSAYTLLCIYLIIITRSYIRRKYNIPERNCVGCEDCCVGCIVPSLSIAQMARHTTEYDLYRAQWCSDTGLPSRVPSIV